MKYGKVFKILESTVTAFPRAPAVVDSSGTMTYSQLWKEALIICRALESAGVRPGMHLGLKVKNGREFVAALFASSMAGAVVVPLGVGLSKPEVTELASELSLNCLVQSGSFGGHPLPGGLSLHFLSRGGGEKNGGGFNDAAFIRPTSGTTGRSKGVVLSHSGVLERVETALLSLKITPEDRVLWVLPMAYHFIVSVILYIRAGAAIVIPEAEGSAESLIEAACQNGVTVIYGGPAEYIQLADSPGLKKLPPLKWAICTAGGVPLSLEERFQKRHGSRLRQVYGIIEAGLPIGNLSEDSDAVDTIGSILNGYEAMVLRDDGAAASAGEVGELLIRGRGMFEGYLNPLIPREQLMKDGWFHTGDLASFDQGGNYRIAGRKKSLIIVSGNKVFSEEVEKVLNDHPAVSLSRVFAAGDNTAEEAVLADVVVKRAVSSDELIEHCRGKLAEFKIPRAIRFVEAISLTHSGKVRRFVPTENSDSLIQKAQGSA